MSYTISEYVSTFLHIGSEYEPHTCSYIKLLRKNLQYTTFIKNISK